MDAASGSSEKHLVEGALVERLRAFPRFATLAQMSLSRLVACGERRALQRGEEILRQGEAATSLFLLLDGRLKMSRAVPGGRKALLALFGPGDPVGISTFPGRPSDATVAALETSLCLEIPHRLLLAAMEERPRLVGDLLPLFLERVAECRECAVEGAFLRVEPRFARLFLRLGESVGKPMDGAVFIPVPLSRQDLADMAGTTIETSIRVMSRWGRDGVVETLEDRFLLRDGAALAQLCGS